MISNRPRPAMRLLLLAAALTMVRQHPVRAAEVRHLSELPSLAEDNPEASHHFQLEGDVWWVNPGKGRLVLHDESRVEELAFDLHGQPVAAGQRVRIEGSGPVHRNGNAYRLGDSGPLVNNNGLHEFQTRSASMVLPAGRHPIRLEYFNNTGKGELKLEYEGPSLPRQILSSNVLFHVPTGSEATVTKDLPGLEFHCYEGRWNYLPSFKQLPAVRSGIATGIEADLRMREERSGIVFTGLIAVPREGLYTFHLSSHDGSRLFIGTSDVAIHVIGSAMLPSARRVVPGQPMLEDEPGFWAETTGIIKLVHGQPDNVQLELSAGAGTMRVEVANAAGLSTNELLNRRARVTGFCQRARTVDGQTIAGVLLARDFGDIELIKDAPETAATADIPTNSVLPTLTTANKVRSLRGDALNRAFPIHLRGVVTCVLPEHRSFVVQDSTAGLYVQMGDLDDTPLPQVSEYVEVHGTNLSGTIRATAIARLGAGILPEPAHPDIRQLRNGSLDQCYVEIRGIIEGLTHRSNGWTRIDFRIQDDTLRIELRRAGLGSGPLESYANAVIRLRGCLFADFDLATQRVKVGQVRMHDADILVDQPAPDDVFAIPSRTVASLTRFNAESDALHRVKVSGQIVYARGDAYFMMDGNDGVRFLPAEPQTFAVGDQVEAVGFPELSAAAPVLRGAVARKIGHAPLPGPKALSSDDLIRPRNDALLVRVQGVLSSLRATTTNQVLEMQAGSWRFLARLRGGADVVSQLQIGSTLELVGVYCAQGGYQALGEDVAPVDLLLNSPRDITVLRTPPWWTLRKLLFVISALAVILVIAMLWITQLHRRVEERTSELAVEIRERQQAEHLRSMELERTRIAQDLHDELGSSITEIGMLSARAKAEASSEEKRNRHLDHLGGKAREMVAALDEIVWAMNPAHDSLGSLISYFSLFADRFLGLAGITWRLESAPANSQVMLDSRRRHQLFLVMKEALTNIVRHSGATEVRVNIQNEAAQLKFSIADNGCGIPADKLPDDLSGISIMRSRIEKLGGSFALINNPGSGITVDFKLPAA